MSPVLSKKEGPALPQAYHTSLFQKRIPAKLGKRLLGLAFPPTTKQFYFKRTFSIKKDWCMAYSAPTFFFMQSLFCVHSPIACD